MECLEIITAAFVATTFMTVFSYAISESFRELYKEPVLLEFLMTSLDFDLSELQKKIAAWSLHYFVGLLFVIGYYLPVWLETDWYSIDLLSSAVFGSIIGVIGIISWKILFRISPEHPPVKLANYYLQLFFAHLIFGLTTAVVHSLLSGDGN